MPREVDFGVEIVEQKVVVREEKKEDRARAAARRLLWWGLFLVVRNLWFGILFVAFVLSVLLNKHLPWTVKLSVEATGNSPVQFDHSASSVVVVLQLSDVHLTNSQGRTANYMRRVCQTVLPAVKPALVLVAGDIVESDFKESELTGYQQEEQWKLYQEIRQNCSSYYDVPWEEAIGNHDIYGNNNVSYWFPGTYTSSGQDIYKLVRSINVTTPAGSVHKLILVSSNMRAIYWPAMLGGGVSEVAEELRPVLKEETAAGRPTIVVGHHPLNVIAEDGMFSDFLTQLNLDETTKYSYHIAGHVHRTIHTRHVEGPVELVANTFKNAAFRLLVFDNGMMSFSEVMVDQWPLIVLTTPKSALSIVAEEPLHLMTDARSIRVVVFSPHAILQVNASVDGQHICELTRVGNSSLYSCPWAGSDDLSSGLHDFSITATDEAGNIHTINEKVSLDGTVAKPSGVMGYVLKCKPRLLGGWWLFGSVVIVVLLFLPRALIPIFKVWKNSTHPFLQALSDSMGPGSFAHIQEVCSGRNTFKLWLRDPALKPWQKALTAFTWQLQSTIADHSKVSWYIWALLLSIWLIHLGPLLIRPYTYLPTFFAFNWGALAGLSFYHNELVMCASAGFQYAVLFPTFSMAARQHDHERKWFLSLSLYDLVLIALQVGGSVGVLYFFWYYMGALWMSPLLYLIFVCDVASTLFFILSCLSRKPSKVSPFPWTSRMGAYCSLNQT